MQNFIFNDGGRSEAGFKGFTGDCGVRAVAIATEKPYSEVYNELAKENKLYSESCNDRIARYIIRNGPSPRKGIFQEIMKSYLTKRGWTWVPTMKIGQGCKVHLKADELPRGRLIVRLSRHYTAIVDGVINDTYEDARGGTRCVYGYYIKS